MSRARVLASLRSGIDFQVGCVGIGGGTNRFHTRYHGRPGLSEKKPAVIYARCGEASDHGALGKMRSVSRRRPAERLRCVCGRYLAHRVVIACDEGLGWLSAACIMFQWESNSSLMRSPDSCHTREVLCITGKWGVGKTFAWNRYLREAQEQKKVGPKRPSSSPLRRCDLFHRTKDHRTPPDLRPLGSDHSEPGTAVFGGTCGPILPDIASPCPGMTVT
jgi:hypothetical protein